MKNLKKALLSSAVLAGLAAGNAYAGTEACFEVYKTAAPLAAGDFNAVYANASCVAADLATTDEVKVAYELTGGATVDFGDVNDLNELQQIVYIPTTDIPGGTKITMTLSGANFAVADNIIHLVKDDGATISAVASTDGEVDGESTITFITKSGITIGAGTRLAFSRVSTGVTPVGVSFENTGCVVNGSEKTVTIAATEAKTDGGTGYSIKGGQSDNQLLIDASPQFITFVGSETVEGEVNAETANADNDPDVIARTQFVYEAGNTGLVLRQTELVHKAGFVNRAKDLDQYIAVSADDTLDLSFVATSAPGATVKAQVFDTQDAGTGALTDSLLDGGNSVPFLLAKPATAQVSLDGTAVFANDEVNADYPVLTNDYNDLYFTLQNEDVGVMNFNYTVNTHSKFVTDSADQLDHCDVTTKTHQVGVNGAVLKVPYTVNGTGNFVRITNEHTVEADVTVDLFSESADGTQGAREAKAVTLGKIPAKSSKVFYVPTIVSEAVTQQGYTGSDGVTGNGENLRHTMTFTVTSPKNTVHGVSVQKLSTGQDRVMPVLDQNDWAQ